MGEESDQASRSFNRCQADRVRVEDLENNNNPTRKDEKQPNSDENKIAKRPKSGEISTIFGKILARSSEISPYLTRSSRKKIPVSQENTTELVGSNFSDLRGGDLIPDPSISVFGERNPSLTAGTVGSVGNGLGSVGGGGWVGSWTA